MNGNGKIYIAVLLLMACAFGFSLHALLAERFERGDTYPPYSTFRSDPRGAKALYLALGRVPGITSRRNFTNPSRLTGEKGVTYLFLGVDEGVMRLITREDLTALEDLAARGNRLVIAFSPSSGTAAGEGAGGKRTGRDNKPKKSKPDDFLSSRWNLMLERFPGMKSAQKEQMKAIRSIGEAQLPASFTVRSNLCFKTVGFWKTIYSVERNPVVVERVIGKGSIVLLADSYPAGNVAMRDERHPRLLIWLLGGNRTAVFDESHLGVFENPGIISLMAKYRLTPFLVGLVLLAGLYFWKNAIPLVPSAGSGRTSDSGIRADKDAISGLVNLLRRNLPPSGLLEACFREWSKSFSREYRESNATRVRIQAIVDQEQAKPAAQRAPASGYREITRILAERKRA